MFLPWPILLGGAALGGLYLAGRNHVDDERPAPRPTPKRPQTVQTEQSPLAGVNKEQWIRFVQVMGDRSNANSSSPSGHLGFFRFSYPRLAELGLVVNARRDKKVWQGAFIPPLTLEGFLGSFPLQHRAFALSSGDFATHLAEEHASSVGSDVDGVAATLSGLLAVLHRAGHRGFDSWISSAEDRKKYPNTTAAFKAANGIF